MNFRKLFISVVTVLSTLTSLSAQENGSQKDSLVRLLSAQSMELIEKDGVDYRKVTGPARFLHNDTYLICDTALWNMSSNEIYAISNVKILQDQTVLTGLQHEGQCGGFLQRRFDEGRRGADNRKPHRYLRFQDKDVHVQ